MAAAGAALVFSAMQAAEAHADVCAPNTAASGTQAFQYTGAEDTWVVPPGVNWIWVTVLGGAGGEEDHSAPGGNGSGVRTYLRVDPGACLAIYVGEYGWGHGGWGWGNGGDHG